MSGERVETLLRKVREGGNDEGVPPQDIDAAFRDFLALSNYPGIAGSSGAASRARRSIESNEDFWRSAATAYEGLPVTLPSFVLTEWLPSSPGRYFTEEAAKRRQEAARMMNHRAREYLPLGKLRMVLGGIGSVRLSAKQTPMGRMHFLGASRSGVSHEGIPIALPHDLYLDVAPRLKDLGACLCDIIGTIEVAPREAGAISYDAGIPKLMVVASDVEIHEQKPATAQVSVSIMFGAAAREYETNSGRDNALGWSFFGFSPLVGRTERRPSLQVAVEWLQDYARRHSAIADPPIFCDFDEQTEHFDMPVDFRIADLFRGDLDARVVDLYARKYGINFHISRHYGDVFSNISNSTIVNRSTVR